jgi:hypothetical protein
MTLQNLRIVALVGLLVALSGAVSLTAQECGIYAAQDVPDVPLEWYGPAMAQAGMTGGWMRTSVSVTGTTPGPDPVVVLDNAIPIIDQARAYGMKTLLVLKDESHRKPDEWKWKQAVSQALQIYGDRADAYAVWNEPNDNGAAEVERCGTRIFEWQGRGFCIGCTINDYVDIVAWTMDVVGGTKLVVVGNTGFTGTYEPTEPRVNICGVPHLHPQAIPYTNRDWMVEVMVRLRNRGYSPPVVSMHTYDTSDNTRIWMGWLRAALNARGFTQPLWLGEAGIAWQEMQAQWYSDHVRNMFTYRYWTNTILFKLHEGPPPNDNTGIYNYDRTPKPAVEALRSVCAPYSPPPPDPCGNFRCEGNEPLTCPGDCPYCNGDGYCDVYAGECAATCPMDCVSDLCQ